MRSNGRSRRAWSISVASVAGKATLAAGVSADGNVAVGYQERADGTRQGARWVDLRQELIPGVTGSVRHVRQARASNHDGSIVAGQLCRPELESDDQSAWVWTSRDGTRCLPAPSRRPSPPGQAVVIHVWANGTSETMFINAVRTLRVHCVEGITANPDVCRHYVEYSVGVVTALNPVIGYERSTELATEAMKTGRGIIELVRKRKILSDKQIAQVLDPIAMTGQGRR